MLYSLIFMAQNWSFKLLRDLYWSALTSVTGILSGRLGSPSISYHWQGITTLTLIVIKNSITIYGCRDGTVKLWSFNKFGPWEIIMRKEINWMNLPVFVLFLTFFKSTAEKRNIYLRHGVLFLEYKSWPTTCCIRFMWSQR